MTPKELPPQDSTCIYCKRGKIRWHATGATCQYCGRTWDNGLTIPFSELREGEIFVCGGEYASYPEETWQKVEPRKNPHGYWGRVNAKRLDTEKNKWGEFGPGVRCLPLSVANPLLRDGRR